MFVQRLEIDLATDGSGNASGASPVATGLISQIRYVKTDFADGVDFSVTLEATGETVWVENDVNANATRAPRQATHSTAGAAALYASGGASVQGMIAMANDRVLVQVSSGGANKSGKVFVLVY